MELAIQVVVQGLLIGAIYSIIALGMGLVYSVSGVVNFAHGDFIVLALYFVLVSSTSLGLDPYLSPLIIAPLMLLLGFAVWHLLIKRVAGGHSIIVAQLTLGIAFVLQNVMLVWQGADERRVRSFVTGKGITVGPVSLELSKMIGFAVAAVLAAGLFYVLQRTDYGRSVRAIHQNLTAATLMGINVKRVQAWTFALAFVITGIAAAVMAPIVTFGPSIGFRFTLIVFIVTIIGGMTNFLGILLGGLIIGVAEAGGAVYLPGTYGSAVPYIAFILILLFLPNGLLERRSR